MIAIDTNVLVRLVTGDDPQQVERILALSNQQDFFVSLTVIIETEWVLRSRFGFERSSIHAAFLALPSLCSINYEDEVGVAWALDSYAVTGELADYIHVVASRMIGTFATFEKRLPDRAGEDAPSQIVLVP